MSTIAPILTAGDWRQASDIGEKFQAENPATGEKIGGFFPVSNAADIKQALHAASETAPSLAAAPPERIAAFLDAYADGIEAAAEDLVAVAHTETALAKEPRLDKVELPRTTGQLRQAAAAVRTFSWTHPIIDTAVGIRSHLAPLGKPVMIFGPNNFPYAFNAIAGSDFASAIAARNPVITKAHPSHPHTSQRLAEIAHEAVKSAGLPPATVQMLYHFDNAVGLDLCSDQRLGAVAFTGSRKGGLAIKAAADNAGVPVYVELSSVNPVFMLPGALAERGAKLAEEFFGSCIMGSGQFCTNPGIVVVPSGKTGDAFVEKVRACFANAAPSVMFSRGVLDNVSNGVRALRAAGAECLAGGAKDDGDGYRYQPTLLTVNAPAFLDNAAALQAEAFGPVSLLVRAVDLETMLELAAVFEGNLTGTMYTASNGDDDDAWSRIATALRQHVGRLIENKMPTGVAVSPAMNHGGPYPSTGHPGFTAVGMPAAIRRFAALHCYDNVAERRLPPELRDRNPGGVARLIDGVWSDADVSST